MAKRDAKISLYVTEDRKRDLERRADDVDMGLSPYVDRLIDRQLVAEAENEVSAQTRATERLQRVIEEGERQIRDATTDLREMQAKTGAYAIANFEFLKQNRGESEIRDALSTGSRRLREDAVPPEDVDGSESRTTDESDTGGGLDIDALQSGGGDS